MRKSQLGRKARSRTRAVRETIARTPVKRKRRTKAETTRIYGTEAHQKWLRDMPCLGCARMGTEDRPHHLHHTKTGGMGKKANAAWQVPLCSECHGNLHLFGPKWFERAYADMLGGFTLRDWAANHAAAWLRWQEGGE
jgi:hypothetical protein